MNSWSGVKLGRVLAGIGLKSGTKNKKSGEKTIGLTKCGKAHFAARCLMLFLMLVFQLQLPVAMANPTGGQVASGAAAINNTTPGQVTINQTSNAAVINWQSFSIGAGETTKFIQPSSASATLNRVLGGQTSIINGTLSANGQVYLLNGNGILVGPNGVVNTAGFIGSTRDLSDADFLSGNLHFTGNNDAGVTNLGKISALGGDVILIGKTVDNQGSIDAANGHVGLAAADDVLITQSGLEHVFVRSTANPGSATGKVGVNNAGSIAAASAELKAANGNIYALATNNSGIIRATGVSSQDGRIWLVAEGNQGVTKNTGELTARKAGGAGGDIETSGGKVIANGTVDVGSGGTWLIDPSDINIDGTTAATIVSTLNGGGIVTEDSSLGSGGNGDITVSAAINWTGTGVLNLFAYRNLNINSAITGNNGSLNLLAGSGGIGTITVPAAISVKNFNLQGGTWIQNAITLPSFYAYNFTISGGSFLRVNGGSGVVGDPYQLRDIYGLQGIGSNVAYEAANWRVVTTIDASGVANWNNGAGFVPISNFTGVFDGNGSVGAISGLTINLPGQSNVGLFGQIGAGGSVSNVVLNNVHISGLSNVGALAGSNAGQINTSSANGTVSGVNSASGLNIGGLLGSNSGNVSNSFATVSVTGYGNSGGLIGANNGLVLSSYATGTVSSYNNATLSGTGIGGLVGSNNAGSIVLSYATGKVNAADSSQVGGLAGASTGAALIQQSYAKGVSVTGYQDVGGLVGLNGASASVVVGKLIDGSSASTVTGAVQVGGLIGNNAGYVTQSSVLGTGTVLARDWLGTAAQSIGGLVGNNSGSVVSSFGSITVGQAAGTTDASYVGGLVGYNRVSGVLSGVYANGTVSGYQNVGGLVGGNDGSLGVQSNASGIVTGSINIGGLVGSNNGLIDEQSFATGAVSGGTSVGGLVGYNSSSGTISKVYAQGSVNGVSNVGGLIGNNAAGNITLSNASGKVTGSSMNVGGLVGNNAGNISASYASGDVIAPTANNVGGLVGNNSGTIGSNSGTNRVQSYASGTLVIGNIAVGGLVGTNSGVIGDALSIVESLSQYVKASANVTGQSSVGGLVGDNLGTVQQATASGVVKGSGSVSNIGGLVGSNEDSGIITVSFASGTVLGNGTGSTNGTATDTNIGGLVGLNLGQISKSYALNSVIGDNAVGGLVGLNNGASAIIQTSYSTGTVTGLLNVGGLAGKNQSGLITQNYSISTVKGRANVGGLVGLNQDRVSENYATGSVSGTTNVGGLVGQNATGATLEQSYATGSISVSGTGLSGGLVGLNSGTVANSYWDENSTATGTRGIGNDPLNTGATGLTSTGTAPTAFSASSYSGLGASGAVTGGASNALGIIDGNSVTAWYMLDGQTRPFLSWEAPVNNPVSNGAYLVYTAHQLQLMAINLGADYVMGKDIDLSETRQLSSLWNSASGFVSIGTYTDPFSGSFNGGSFNISNLYINTPQVSYAGLFGVSAGALSSISLSGTVIGFDNVGLLAGLNLGSIHGASASGAVGGDQNIGGLVGDNQGVISSFAVNARINGNSNAGGVAGSNSGLIENGYALGSVTGSGAAQNDLGGLVGLNSGTVTVAYATGSVTGNATSTNVGGNVGRNTSGGVISQVYSTGVVSGGTNVGGVAGAVDNGAAILQSYSTGTVKGGTNVGGVAGLLSGSSQINSSYASGKVSGSNAAGGLLGQVTAGGSYANLFWDSSNATRAIGIDNGSGGLILDLHGKTINVNTADYNGFDTALTPGFSTGVGGSVLVYGSGDSVWRIQSGWEFPLLTQLSTEIAGTAYSDAAHTVVASGATVTLNSGTKLLNTTTANASGNYVFLFAADDGLFNYLPNTGKTLRISDAAHKADSIAASNYNNNGVPSLLADIAPADTWANTVRVVSNGLNNDLLLQAGSAFISVSSSNAFGGTNLNISENFEVGSSPIIDSYTINGDITVQGNITFDSNGQVAEGYDHTVTLYAQSGTGNTKPEFVLNASLSGDGVNRVYIIETDGNFINNVGTGAFQTPNGSWLVYSQNPEGSDQAVEDDTGGLNQYHLYGTNFMETPAYLLAPGLNYQIYSFTPTLTLTAVAAGADPATGSLTVQYGAATPGLTYIVSGLLSGDTVTAGQTFNQVLSGQPGEETVYAKYSSVGDYAVSFIGSTLPTSLIGYNLVFNSGNIHVEPNSSEITVSVSGNQSFGYIGSGQHFVVDPSSSQIILDDPNLGFVTTVGQYANVGTYLGTISLNATSQANYSNVHLIVNDSGYTVNRAQITVSAYGTSIYGDAVNNPQFTSGQSVYDSNGNIVSLSSAITASGGFSYANPGVTSASNVGSYNFAVSGPANPAAGALSNYTVTFEEGTYVITPRALVINATQNESYNYDGTPGLVSFGTSDYVIGATAAGTGLVNGDQVTGLMGRVNDTNPNVNHYNYTQGTLAAADSGGNASGNYIITFHNNGYGLDITPRAITISVQKSATKTYGDADPGFTYANGFYSITAGSLANGESFTSNGSLGRQSGENVNNGIAYQFNGVGTVGIVNSGNNSTTGNYAITFDNSGLYGLTITKAPLVVTASNLIMTYNGTNYSGGNGVSYSGFKFSDNKNSLGGALSYYGSSQGAINVGSYDIIPQGYTSGNYDISYAKGTLTINPATLKITAISGSRTYDATAFSGGYGVSYSGFKGSDNAGNALTGSAIYGGSAQNAVNAGTYTITVSGFTANNGNYTINFVSGNLVIGKAPLTVTADNKGKVYGAVDPTLTYTPSGQLYGDDTYGVISGVQLSTVTGQAATGGTHAINVSGATATNYSITMVPGTLTVTPAPITITVLSGSSTYGDSPGNPGLSATGLQYGENVSVLTGISNSFGIAPTTNAGSYELTLQGSLTNPNYSFNPSTDVTNGSWIVKKAALTITANSGSKTYGDTYVLSGTAFSSNGLKNGESIGSVSLASSGTGATANVGNSPYTITISDATGGSFNTNNYDIDYVNGLLTVNRATLTLTANSGSKTYGDTYTALTGTEFLASGLKNGETVGTVSLSSAGAVATANVTGTGYSINISNVIGGTFDPDNYTIKYVNGTLMVKKANLVITANSGTKVYGDMYVLSGTAFSSSGLKNGESIGSVTLASAGASGTAGVSGSPYAINASNATGGTFSSGNYSITYTPGTLTVTPAPVTITVLSGSSIYGSSPGNPGLSADGLKNGQTVSALTGISNSFGITPTSGVNTYTLSVAGGLTNPNYQIVGITNGSWVVTPAALTITANSGTKTYGDTYVLSGTAFSSNGLKNGESIGLVSLASSGTGATASVGSSPYTITISDATGGSFNPDNYTITYVNGSLKVTPAQLTITANSGTKTYGDTYVLSGTAFTSNGLKNGESIGSVSLASSGTGATANVGNSPYTITISDAIGGSFDINNYSVTYVNGSLTVNRAALTITANSGSKTYGDTYVLSGTAFNSSGLKNGETIGTVTLNSTGAAATANVNGSPYAIIASDATGGSFDINNYSVNYINGALTVTPAHITVTALSGSSTYGDSPLNPGLGATGLKNGQDVSVLTGLSNSFGITNNTNADTYSLSVNGALTNANYTVENTVDGSWIVKKAALTITANSGSKTYGDTYVLSGTAFSSNGLKNGESIGSVSLASSGTGATANVGNSPYTITISDATGGSFNINNYDIDYVNGSLTVNRAALTITANSGSKTYGETYTLSGTAFASNGLKNGETIGSVTLSSTGAAATAAVAGSPYLIVASDATGGTFDSNNYDIAYVNGSLTIGRAALTITANSGTKVYGDTYVLSGSAGFGSSGLQNGETIGSVNLASDGAAATANVTGSPYAITIDGAAGGSFNSNNYNITYENGSLTVTPAQVVVTALGGSSTYGDSPLNPGLSASGLKNGQDVSVLTGLYNSFGITNTSNAGDHALQVDGELTNANYTVANTVDGNWTVHRADLTITANSGTKVYGDTYTLSGTAFSSSGLKNGETIGSVQLASDGATTTANVNGSPYAITVDGAAGGTFDINNYSVSYVNGSLTVTPAHITVTALSGSSTYGDSPLNPGLSANGLKNGQDVSVLTGLYNSFGITNTSNAGNHTLTVDGELTNANYTVDSLVDGNWFVKKAALTITANSGSKTYGDTYVLSGTAFSSNGLKNGESIGSVSLASSGTGATANVGNSPYTITISDATGGSFNTNNYDIDYVNGSLTVNPAQIIVTALGGSSTYGDSPLNPGLSASGLKNGQDVGVLTGLYNSFGITNTSNAGDHSLQVDGELTNANYTVVNTVDGTWTVHRADLTITANSGTKTYGDTYVLSGTAFSSSGLKNGETIGTVTLSSTGAAATANVSGSPYAINASDATGGSFDINNYSVTYQDGSLTVNPAQIIVTALGGSSTYGDSPLNPGLSASGLKNGQDVSVLTGLSNSFGITNTSNAGDHTLQVDGELTNANYTVVNTVDGTWTVHRADLTITANSGTKTYGDVYTALSGTEFSSSGLKNGETIGSVNLSSTGAVATANVTGSPYAINASDATGGSFNISNYTVTYENGSLTVTPAQIIVTALGGSSTYGDSPLNPGLSASGLKNGQDVSVLTGLSNNFGITNTTGAGDHSLQVDGELTNANYTVVSTVDGNWKVNKADLTITANSGTKTYGDVYAALSGTEFSSSGLKNGESIGSVDLSSDGAVAAANVTGSPYVINIGNAAGGSFDINNYSVTYENGSLTVNPAQIIVTALGGSSVYGTSPLNPGLNASGLKNGQDVGVLTGLSNSFGITNTSNAGDYALHVNGELTNANYTVVSTVDGSWTVNRADLTITASSQKKMYGDSFVFQGTEFTVTGLLNNDSVSQVTLSSAGTPALATPGAYPILMLQGSAVGNGLSNYNINFVASPFTVTPTIFGQPAIPRNARTDYEQLISGLYHSGNGAWHFYNLEVPGSMLRSVPADFPGLAAGFSVLDVQIGLDSMYDLDRFQTYRH
ncbi:MAG: filamentous hemagglutinin N-terminal domain-containing protein [Verrucomicrobiales bacterium]|jgi:filamentous hemagglutinin family protein|nr:filamentous hemagglutinin N-terminal domain-containing protein [Verrucomicrobiales bacterium]